MRMHVTIIALDGERKLSPVSISGRSVREMRSALELAACRRYGREGRDWRMVPDDGAIVPMYVRAKDGECLALR